MPGAGRAPEHTAKKMGVEIETITPGDGKATAHKGNVFVFMTRCMLALLCMHVSDRAAENTALIAHARYILSACLVPPQEGLSPKKDRRAWCIMWVSSP